jgi:preprotein translocase subunit SecE
MILLSIKLTNPMNNISKYIRATMVELRQVAWPSQNQALVYTALVIGISAVVALYVGAFDYLFAKIINAIVGLV